MEQKNDAVQETTTTVALKDLTEDVKRNIQDKLTSYTVALCYTSESTNKPLLCGSGTLVYANDKFGVLTAGHVVETLREKQSIGIAGAQRGAIRIASEHLIYEETGGPYDAGENPDLGLIQLQPKDVAAIRARKSFLNLDKAYDEVTGNTYQSGNGVWCTCGFPGESKLENELYGLTGIGVDPSCHSVGEMDYLGITAELAGLPRTFGGMSGGGLWHVPLLETDGSYEIAGCYFTGVMFYETRVVDEERDIKCHGPNSIYAYVGEQWFGGLDC